MEWAAQTPHLGPLTHRYTYMTPTNSYPTSLHPLPHTAPTCARCQGTAQQVLVVVGSPQARPGCCGRARTCGSASRVADWPLGPGSSSELSG